MSRSAAYPIARFDDDAMRQHARAYMGRWHLSENELARTIGMSTGNIHRWFRGEIRMSADYVVSVAHVCDLDLNTYVVPVDEP